MLQRMCRPWIGLVLAVPVGLPGIARADDTEYRDFRILVDGKDSGYSQMTITRKSDGSMNMTASAAVRISQVFFSYSFNTQSSEWWKDGQLQNMKTSTTENGKRTEVIATSQAGGIQLQVNNQARIARADVWPSSFWKLADAKYHNKEIPILESDTGKEYVGRLQYVATEEMNVVKETQKCYHFRITGGPSPVDLWFDRYYLLVRQDFVESGHRTSVQLTKIRR
jgi:hypothetical protein